MDNIKFLIKLSKNWIISRNYILHFLLYSIHELIRTKACNVYIN